MAYTKEQRIINSLRGYTNRDRAVAEKKTPIADEMFLPNHSGMSTYLKNKDFYCRIIYVEEEAKIKSSTGGTILLDSTTSDGSSFTMKNNSESQVYLEITPHAGINKIDSKSRDLRIFGANYNYLWCDNTDGAVYIYNDLLPDTNNNSDLGSSSKQWKDLYVKNKIYINGEELLINKEWTIYDEEVNASGDTEILAGAGAGVKYRIKRILVSNNDSSEVTVEFQENGSASPINGLGPQLIVPGGKGMWFFDGKGLLQPTANTAIDINCSDGVSVYVLVEYDTE